MHGYKSSLPFNISKRSYCCTSTKMKSEPNSTNPIQNEIFLLAEFVTNETQVKPLPEKMKIKLLDALSAYPSLKQSKLDLYGQKIILPYSRVQYVVENSENNNLLIIMGRYQEDVKEKILQEHVTYVSEFYIWDQMANTLNTVNIKLPHDYLWHSEIKIKDTHHIEIQYRDCMACGESPYYDFVLYFDKKSNMWLDKDFKVTPVTGSADENE